VPTTTRPPLDLATLTATTLPTLPVDALGARLRPWVPGDAAAVREAYADPAITRWHVRTLETDAEAGELVARWAGAWARGDAHWAVTSSDDDALLGRVAVKVADPDGVGEIGYWTAPAARGRGVTPAAVRTAARWAFAAGYHRLQLVHSTRNPASCRAALKAGFAAEATVRGSVLHADGWHDMHQHARLA
jgi:ribosomal-protein-alanine N-acetyltransferase